MFVHGSYGLAFTTLFFRNYYAAAPYALVKAARPTAPAFSRFGRTVRRFDVHAHRDGPPDPPGNSPTRESILLVRRCALAGDFQPIVALNNLVTTSTGAKEYNLIRRADDFHADTVPVCVRLASISRPTAGAVKGQSLALSL